MSAEPVEARRLELDAAGVMAGPAGREAFEPVTTAEDGACLAAQPGPAEFRVPVVLPAAGRVTAGSVTFCPSAEAEVCIGNGPCQRLHPGEKLSLTLTGESFTKAVDWTTPELDFSDFRLLEVRATVNAAEGDTARLHVSGTIEYTLPVESAAGYLTYIMTQA